MQYPPGVGVYHILGWPSVLRIRQISSLLGMWAGSRVWAGPPVMQSAGRPMSGYPYIGVCGKGKPHVSHRKRDMGPPVIRKR